MNVNSSVSKALDLSGSNHEELLELISEKEKESDDPTNSITKGNHKGT